MHEWELFFQGVLDGHRCSKCGAIALNGNPTPDDKVIRLVDSEPTYMTCEEAQVWAVQRS